MQNTSFIAIFLTGLLTGGLTCLAVQGGLLAATIAQREEERLKEKTTKGAGLSIVWFLTAKLVAYTILGLLLGWFGSLFTLSLTARLIMQFAVVIFMFGTAMALLDVHPFFRYFIIQPPKFLMRLVRNKSKSLPHTVSKFKDAEIRREHYSSYVSYQLGKLMKTVGGRDVFAPGILGAFTVFIPCGTTQAMMALAIASGSAIRGAGIMYAFVLGTSPVFFILGYFATRLGEFWHKKFLRVASLGIIILTVFNLNNALALTGKPITIGDLSKRAFCAVAFCGSGNNQTANTDEPTGTTITINSFGYTPNVINLKKDSDVTLKLINKDGTSCVQAFTIPSLNVQKIVPVGGNGEVSFHTPKQSGQIAFMCSMGMYRGVINVN